MATPIPPDTHNVSKTPRAGLSPAEPAELVDQRGGDARACGADRMPQRDRAAIRIQAGAIESEIAIARDHLRGESFVQLDRRIICRFPAGALFQFADGRHRTDSHDARIHRGDGRLA